MHLRALEQLLWITSAMADEVGLVDLGLDLLVLGRRVRRQEGR
jgi:hypothetical protein